MSSNDYTRHSICYLNEIERRATANNLLYFGYLMFAKAYRVSNFEHIKRNILEIEKRGSVGPLFDFIFVEEILLDSIKISICFENYLKAQLLLQGYSIHFIVSISDEHERLAAIQKKCPVPIDEIIQLQGFVYDTKVEMNILLGVPDKTLYYSTLLDKRKYVEKENITNDILSLLIGYNNMRNTLHFLDSHMDRYDQSLIQHVQMLIDFVNGNIKTKSNELALERGMIGLLIP